MSCVHSILNERRGRTTKEEKWPRSTFSNETCKSDVVCSSSLEKKKKFEISVGSEIAHFVSLFRPKREESFESTLIDVLIRVASTDGRADFSPKLKVEKRSFVPHSTPCLLASR